MEELVKDLLGHTLMVISKDEHAAYVGVLKCRTDIILAE